MRCTLAQYGDELGASAGAGVRRGDNGRVVDGVRRRSRGLTKPRKAPRSGIAHPQQGVAEPPKLIRFKCANHHYYS